MPYDFNIYHSQVTPSIPDYDTVTTVLTSDLENYATKSYVDNFGDDKYLSLLGGTLEGDLILTNKGGNAKSLILKSSTGIPIAIRAGVTFINALTSETGIVVPGLLITDGRLDITPDPILNRAEFRIKGANSQFNIFNINTFEFYMRVNPDTSVMFGQNTVALSAGAVAMGVSTSAINLGAHAEGRNCVASGSYSHAEGTACTASGSCSHAEGNSTKARGNNSHAEGDGTIAEGANSHAEGLRTVAFGNNSHAAGRDATAAHPDSWIWHGTGTSNELPSLSTTSFGQFAVHAGGGISLNNRVGIGTDSVANALTVVGSVSATGTVFSSGAPVVVSSSQFETTTTNISSISNIVTLSQATYNALTVKQPTTLYVII